MLEFDRKQMAAIGETQLRHNLADFLNRHLGGRADGLRQVVVGEAAFVQGEEVLLFLTRAPARAPQGPLYTTVGMAQGKLRIERRGGEAYAVTNFEGATLLGGTGAAPRAVLLQDVLRTIRASLEPQ